jgi:transcriptional regulator with XRE-family HTH domain
MAQRDYSGERLERISKLLSSQKARAAYIKGKLAVLVPSQIRQLRLNSTNPPMPNQKDLGREIGLHQSRISMFESPGAANVTIDTLARLAAGLRCGLKVEFVPFSEMLHWEDSFSVVRLENDNPASASASENQSVAGLAESTGNLLGSVRPMPMRESESQNPIDNEQAAFGAAAGY